MSNEIEFNSSYGYITYRFVESDELISYSGNVKKPVMMDWVEANEVGKGGRDPVN